MWRRKLLSPLSATLRRTLPSASRVSLDSTPQTLLSASLSSFGSLSGEYESRAFTIRRFHFLGNLKFPAENFCLKSVERCWNCNSVAEAAPFLVCENCRSVQPVDHAVDFFQIFGLEKKYQIEVENLEGKYKNWQKILHPDIVHSKSKKEKEYAAEQSARVIDAYRTLTNPLSRATYILKLEGEDADEEKTISEPELLTEIMETREAVEEAADSQALSQILAQVLIPALCTLYARKTNTLICKINWNIGPDPLQLHFKAAILKKLALPSRE
ncbi:iron-sulfur cluster co-chaperone protein HscB homolog isoform X2 [Actinidia eriantha]|uniref:iron-sulfur cluster co-chaperone protein HscB homolog isoform X2 n=1 Tax=Actinidia eriantha TaxID=165200 RepID=UPI00258BDDD3|nr:iron-sulfur cluster co-chaperone protein HscB homolog isoform X2 [Actinidia eriantha]XP_057506768.1 iron-sulfur cluster co-chaperone protein HscB homolog isoform X2 [Actinidia eriantha]XP_057506769.1 iron-sulfur cluster co-chaperone protein HscB homolog isoform X2 [Actinidia eriantha]